MWVTSLIATNKSAFISQLANKYNTSFFGYPLNIQRVRGKLFVTFYGFTNATKQTNAAMFADMQESSLVRNVELHENSFILCMEQPKESEHLYSANILYLKPILVKPNFEQVYTLASWNREDLNAILKSTIPKVKFKLQYIKEEPIANIGLFTPTNLTNKQSDAFALAKSEGYYTFPKRNAHLHDLAKKSKLSLATYQAHLRKAEQKILTTYVNLA